MDAHVITVVTDCTRASDAGTMTFPEVVGRLMGVGVESYYTDLRRANKVYYMPDGESHVVDAEPVHATAALAFDAAGVEAAVREIQAQKIDYRRFCEKIYAAGCVSYIVSMAGRRAVYLGRTGEAHVELFPPAK